MTISSENKLYSGIDLISDSISGNQNVDIYDELLKRTENEINQLDLFHKWIDGHRNIFDLSNDNERLYKLKELSNDKENKNNSNVRVGGDSNNTDTNGNTYSGSDNIQNMESIFDDIENREIFYYNTYENRHHHINNANDMFFDVLDNNVDANNTPVDYIHLLNGNHSRYILHPVDIPTKVRNEMNVINKELFQEECPISYIWSI
ncbi:erythrocyte membrane protein 1, PfEMP1, putative [Plasmodium sp.]|nr:erythrocyte membrane protein 1, PfEMP1, putative [Plasmodium sp.]